MDMEQQGTKYYVPQPMNQMTIPEAQIHMN
jgi:hypothetical protein